MPPWALACAGVVLAAILLEMVSGSWANSPAPGWAEWVAPLAWPAPVRALWWLLVAGAAAGYHRGLALAGRPRPVLAVLTVGAFVAFAAGIATGASWATWH